jgi:hypothetical protein
LKAKRAERCAAVLADKTEKESRKGSGAAETLGFFF